MADEVRADPVDLGRAAGLSLTESIALFDALRAAREGVPLPAAALGSSASADGVASSHVDVVEAAGLAVERLIAVLEQDVEALYQTAFAYQLADRLAAERLGRVGPGIPI